jgi:hypothetical protein
MQFIFRKTNLNYYNGFHDLHNGHVDFEQWI